MTDTDLARTYDHDFYSHQRTGSELAAERVVPEILDLFPVDSVVDFGCGVGGWLREFAKAGVSRILGLEGGDVPSEQLCIPHEHFRQADFTKELSVGSFDLAVSLEVAEHIPKRFADHFVGLLTDAAPLVLFSAAIPGQGGTEHINEQWPSFWIEKFSAKNYQPLDIIRPRIWSDSCIPVWYRQNMLVFCHADHLAKMKSSPVSGAGMDVVHPDLWADRIRLLDQRMPRPVSILGAFRTMGFACKVMAQRVASRLSMKTKS